MTGITTIPEELRSKAKVVNVKELWSSHTEQRKAKILSYFSLTAQDVEQLGGKSAILFTQPFVADTKIVESELIEIYRTMLEGVDTSKLVIKTHPRDSVDYTKYFPEVDVFTKLIPMELLSLIGVEFDDAYTVSTTAVFSLPSTTKIHFAGTAVHPKIESFCGKVTLDMFQR